MSLLIQMGLENKGIGLQSKEKRCLARSWILCDNYASTTMTNEIRIELLLLQQVLEHHILQWVREMCGLDLRQIYNAKC